MSRTLNLVDGLLLMGRRHQQFGRARAALTVLARLAGFRELPRAVAEETQARLGEIQLRRRKFRRARRHLAAALRYDPDNARYHYFLGAALRQQDEGQWERAAGHYRRSLELDPDRVECLTEFGLLAVRLGHADEGLRHLHRATELRPGDPDILAKQAEGLRLAGRPGEARAALWAGLFRNPRDRRFRQLWADFQFRQLRREQRQRRAREGTDDGPVLLPFTPARAESAKALVLRHDGPATIPSPHDTRAGRLPDRRHVP
jgi:tetratricopeptide (TPR) repeat protein